MTIGRMFTTIDFFSFGMTILKTKSADIAPMNDCNLRLFRSNFGVSPRTMQKCWTLLLMHAASSKIKPKHLLWTCLFLKTYGKECTHCSICQCDPKTFRRWIWIVVRAISNLEAHVVSTANYNHKTTTINMLYNVFLLQIIWDNRKKHDSGDDCLVSVDCTDVEIQEPKPFSSKWYSHKHNGPGLRYEVALSLKRGDIVWIHGPFPCGKWPDIAIFRVSLKSFLDENERVEVDNGYRGEDPISCKTPGGISSMIDNRIVERKRIRARHETVNARLKSFSVLKQVYRHALIDHVDVFSAVAVLVQLGIEEGERLFDI